MVFNFVREWGFQHSHAHAWRDYFGRVTCLPWDLVSSAPWPWDLCGSETLLKLHVS